MAAPLLPYCPTPFFSSFTRFVSVSLWPPPLDPSSLLFQVIQLIRSRLLFTVSRSTSYPCSPCPAAPNRVTFSAARPLSVVRGTTLKPFFPTKNSLQVDRINIVRATPLQQIASRKRHHSYPSALLTLNISGAGDLKESHWEHFSLPVTVTPYPYPTSFTRPPTREWF